MSRSNTRRRSPTRDDFAAVSWLVSRRVWVGTLVFVGLLLVSLAGLAAVYFGANAVGAVRRATALPASVLAVFLSARALSLVVTQRYRDRQIRSGRETPGSDVSVVGMLTVASFSTVGLLAAVVAFPLVVTLSGLVHLVAVGVTVLVVPITFPLLIHQLTEKASADRQRRGYRVSPAVWTFLWTLPVVVLAWFLVVSHPPVSVYVPDTVAGVTLASGLTGRTVEVGAWHIGFAAISTPTVLVVLYAVRRTLSVVLRAFSP
jgi:hypothetical protein